MRFRRGRRRRSQRSISWRSGAATMRIG